jgi:hypothetical protein
VDGGEKFGRGTQCQLKWRGCVALPRGEIESHARGSRGGVQDLASAARVGDTGRGGSGAAAVMT